MNGNSRPQLPQPHVTVLDFAAHDVLDADDRPRAAAGRSRVVAHALRSLVADIQLILCRLGWLEDGVDGGVNHFRRRSFPSVKKDTTHAAGKFLS